jgi:hypothetical protein
MKYNLAIIAFYVAYMLAIGGFIWILEEVS